jgi:hypothetical protein
VKLNSIKIPKIILTNLMKKEKKILIPSKAKSKNKLKNKTKNPKK